MTPEERAQDIFDRIVRLGKYRDVGVAYEPIPLIAEHIRQARAEALEEAAKIFDSDDFFVAEQIRALKQPAEGEE